MEVLFKCKEFERKLLTSEKSFFVNYVKIKDLIYSFISN